MVGEAARTRRRRQQCTDKAGLEVAGRLLGVAVCCRRRTEGESEGQGEGALGGTAKASGDDGADEDRRMSREGDTAGASVVEVEMNVTRLDWMVGLVAIDDVMVLEDERRDGSMRMRLRNAASFSLSQQLAVGTFPRSSRFLFPLQYLKVPYLTLDEHRVLAVLEQGSRLTQTDRPGAGDCG